MIQMYIINNKEVFLDIETAAKCYYQDRYIKINSESGVPEQKIIDNLDLYYHLDKDVYINVEKFPLSKKQQKIDSESFLSPIVIYTEKKFHYNGFLKFKNKLSHVSDIDYIDLLSEEIMLTTTEYSNSEVTHLVNRNARLKSSNDNDTELYARNQPYLYEFYVKLSDLKKLSIKNGIALDEEFYAPIIVESFELADYISAISGLDKKNIDINNLDIIESRDSLIVLTAALIKDTQLAPVTYAIDRAIRIWNVKNIIIDELNFDDEENEENLLPDYDELNAIIFGNKESSVHKQNKIEDITKILTELPVTNKNIDKFKRTLPDAWREALFNSSMPKIKEQATDFEDDDIPHNIYHTANVYEEVWQGFNAGTTNLPKKAQVEDIVKRKGIHEPKDIEAIIRLSMPEGLEFGKRPNSNKENWLPLSERNAKRS